MQVCTCNIIAIPLVFIAIFYNSGSQFILKPAPRPDEKIIFAPLASFDIMFFGLTSLISIVREEKFAPQEVSSRTPIENHCSRISRTVVLNLFRALAHFKEPQIFMAQFLAVAHFDYVCDDDNVAGISVRIPDSGDDLHKKKGNCLPSAEDGQSAGRIGVPLQRKIRSCRSPTALKRPDRSKQCHCLQFCYVHR